MSESEIMVREFARVWDSPNVREALAYRESGRLAWVDVAALFARSYGAASRGV